MTKETSAVQWLTPAQTVGKEYGFLFTQLQPIHARSFFPCQDTPSIKATYDAKVHVPKGMTALMSALSTNEANDESVQDFTFQQLVPIPVNF